LGLKIHNVSVDGWVVVEKSTGGSLGDFLWVLEELSPLLENWKSFLDLLAVSDVSWELSGHLSNNGESVQDAGDVVFLEVGEDDFHVGLKNLLVLDAGLEVGEVFKLDELTEESFNEFDGSGDLWVVSLDSLDLSKQVSEDNSNIVSGVVEVSSSEVSVGGFSLSHDFSVVGQSVGDNDLGVGLGISELGRPVLDLSNVFGDLLAVSESRWNLLGESQSGLGGINVASNISFLDISKDLGNLTLDNGLVLHAFLDVWEIVVSNHTVDESSKELLGVDDGDWDSGLHVLLNWSEGVDEHLGHVFSSLEVVAAVVVALEGRDVRLDSSEVGENVLEDLFGGGLDVLELGEVSLNSVDVVRDVLAVGEGSWEFSGNLHTFLDSSNDGLDGSLFEVTDGGVDVIDEGLVVLHALLEFWEVVLSNKTVHKSSNELDGSIEVNGVGGGGKGSEGKGGSHF
jgi:hypothetical protein